MKRLQRVACTVLIFALLCSAFSVGAMAVDHHGIHLHTSAETCDHTYGGWKKVDDEYHKRSCSACGDVEIKEHNWDDGVMVQEASHTSTGRKEYTCVDCGAVLVERIPKIEHNFSGWRVENQNTHKRTCPECGTSQSAPHEWDEGIVLSESTHTVRGERMLTCTVCGSHKIVLESLDPEHDYQEWEYVDENQHRCVCSCGASTDIYEPHVWDEGVVTEQNTHFVAGVRTLTCTLCGGTKEIEEPPLSEHFYEWTYINDTKHYGICACGAELEGNHNFFWVHFDSARHKGVCTCGAIVFQRHTWNPGEVILEPTHLTYGIKLYTCTECRETKTEKIAKLPDHSFEFVTNLNQTYHKVVCSCGESEMREHHWGNRKQIGEPTHLTEGLVSYTCSECGIMKIETVERLTKHSFGAWQYLDGDRHQRTCICGHVEYAEHDASLFGCRECQRVGGCKASGSGAVAVLLLSGIGCWTVRKKKKDK